MKILNQFGWSAFAHSSEINPDLSVGRVVSILGFKYYLITERGEIQTELSGKLLYENENESLPKVGDWVLFKAYDDVGYVIELLPRKNLLSRRAAGNQTIRQGLAANVDFALIVQGLDINFDVMRLERYLVQLAACQIEPMIILNKSDLITDREPYLNEVKKLQRNCSVVFCSTVTGEGIGRLRDEILQANKTYILIGSSGAGKSSLLNTLMDRSLQVTNTVSDSNNKGRHTTTSRDLFQLPNGSLVIDTPGMREFGVTFEEGSSSAELFPVIEQHASNCRFADCTHMHEEGCAVLRALVSGEIKREVYDSYVKLVKEQRRFQISADEKKRMGKQSGKLAREAIRHRRKYKF